MVDLVHRPVEGASTVSKSTVIAVTFWLALAKVGHGYH
jgi:hypothetical protein